MKHYNSIPLTIALFLMGAIKALALEICIPNNDGVKIYYDVISETELGVSRYVFDPYNDRYKGVVNIPETVTYGGRTGKVTSIGEYAFNNC